MSTTKPVEISRLRLLQQQISQPSMSRPEELVGWMGAIQAQDYSGAKWAIGLRIEDGTCAKVDRAIAQKSIVRSWLFRGTLHFVAAKDYHWMRELVAERLVAGTVKRRADLEIDDKTLTKARKIFIEVMQGGKEVRRDELMALLKKVGIRPDNQRGYHLLWRCAMDGLICFGVHRDKQPTFALAEEWLPKVRDQAREKSLALLAERYFKSRGPATIKDFVWWSGLKISEAKAGLDGVGGRLRQKTWQGSVYWMDAEFLAGKKKSSRAFLLPGFDEYLLGYADRSVTLAPEHCQKIVPGNNGMFMPMMVERGKIVGTWKRELEKKGLHLRLIPFENKSGTVDKVWRDAAKAYGEFLGRPVKFTQS